jgi:hypothetical protein
VRILFGSLFFAMLVFAQFGSNANSIRGQRLCSPLGPPTDGQALTWIAASNCWNPSGVATQGTTYTLGTGNYLQGSASGWQLGSVAAAPAFPIWNPIGGSGAFHFLLLPGTDGSTNGIYLSNAADTTLTNLGQLSLIIRGATALVQTANFGTGTPVTVQNFGETPGSSALTQWNIQFAGTTAFQVTPSSITVPVTPAVTGTRYVCVDTTGKLVSSTTACSGT